MKLARYFPGSAGLRLLPPSLPISPNSHKTKCRVPNALLAMSILEHQKVAGILCMVFELTLQSLQLANRR